MSRVRISSPAPALVNIDAFSTQDKQKSTITTVAHVAQSVERFLGKEEVHRFNSDRGLHWKITDWQVFAWGGLYEFKHKAKSSSLV